MKPALDPWTIRAMHAASLWISDASCILTPLSGGLSGVRVWTMRALNASYIVRAWPKVRVTAAWLRWTRELAARAIDHGLGIIPRPMHEIVDDADVLWECTTFLSGRAVESAPTSGEQLSSACKALARLHEAWASGGKVTSGCPAIKKRLQIHRASMTTTGPDAPLAHRIDRALAAWRPRMADLDPWADRAIFVQPCHGDPWLANWLFWDDKVTGLIDLGCTRVDSPLCDLARLLASFTATDRGLFAEGLDAYVSIRPVGTAEQGLVRTLADTGRWAALAQWRQRMATEPWTEEQRTKVVGRIETLLHEMEMGGDRYPLGLG